MIRFQYLLWRGKYCPIIEVEVNNKDKRIRTLAYVDTGATYSVFHSDFCEELGLAMRSGNRVDITVGDGGIIPVYLHKLMLRIEDLKIVGDIGFSDRLGTGVNILGREGILDEYMVCFDGQKKEVIWHV
ncbi:MAG: retropepsin-like aspartic protease [Candidatus Thermoplasmatota archaeon]